MRALILIVILGTLSGCGFFQEIGRTGEFPERTQNQVRAARQLYCESLQNINRIIVRALRVIDPEWVNSCDAYFAGKTDRQ